MALNSSLVLDPLSLPNMAASHPSPKHVQDLQGLLIGKAGIPYDFACWVLTHMPPSAALKGLGFEYGSSACSELHGTIRSYIGNHLSNLAIQLAVFRDLESKEHGGKDTSLCYKGCAVEVLIRTVGHGVNLAHLQMGDEDSRFEKLMGVDPDWHHRVQFLQSPYELPYVPACFLEKTYQPPAKRDEAQAVDGWPCRKHGFHRSGEDQSRGIAEWPCEKHGQHRFLYQGNQGAGGYQQQTGLFQQQQEPRDQQLFVSGDGAIFKLSNVPDPINDDAQDPRGPYGELIGQGTDSLYYATPRDNNTPFSPGTPLPQTPFSRQSPLLHQSPVQPHTLFSPKLNGYHAPTAVSIPDSSSSHYSLTPGSPAASLLSPNPQGQVQFNTSFRSFTPGSPAASLLSPNPQGQAQFNTHFPPLTPGSPAASLLSPNLQGQPQFNTPSRSVSPLANTFGSLHVTPDLYQISPSPALTLASQHLREDTVSTTAQLPEFEHIENVDDLSPTSRSLFGSDNNDICMAESSAHGQPGQSDAQSPFMGYTPHPDDLSLPSPHRPGSPYIDLTAPTPPANPVTDDIDPYHAMGSPEVDLSTPGQIPDDWVPGGFAAQTPQQGHAENHASGSGFPAIDLTKPLPVSNDWVPGSFSAQTSQQQGAGGQVGHHAGDITGHHHSHGQKRQRSESGDDGQRWNSSRGPPEWAEEDDVVWDGDWPQKRLPKY